MSTPRFVTAAQVADRDLPTDLTGIRWPATQWTECRGHLEANAADYREFGGDLGIVLTGEIECDACRERDQLEAQDRLDLTPAGGEFYRSDRADPLWDGPDDFAAVRREAEADNRADDLAAWRHQQWERGA